LAIDTEIARQERQSKQDLFDRFKELLDMVVRALQSPTEACTLEISALLALK
jgi:hypothetical protein